MSQCEDCVRCSPSYSFASLTIEELTTNDREFSICEDCTARLNPTTEATRYCPVDGEPMRKLVKWARGKKLDCVYGDVFEHNQAMLSLAESLGFERSGEDAAGLIRVRLDLKPKAA